MLSFFFKKQRQIEALIYRYLDSLRMTQKFFAEALTTCIKESASGNFDFLTIQTHKFESKADDLRDEINELHLWQGANTRIARGYYGASGAHRNHSEAARTAPPYDRHRS